jgi:hypothetical protein
VKRAQPIPEAAEAWVAYFAENLLTTGLQPLMDSGEGLRSRKSRAGVQRIPSLSSLAAMTLPFGRVRLRRLLRHIIPQSHTSISQLEEYHHIRCMTNICLSYIMNRPIT